MADPFVVVGGDAAGLSAASKFAREAPGRDVIVFEKGRWVSYALCGMPYYVKGEVDRLTDLLSLTPDAIEERGIDLRRGHEVVDVSPDDRTVTVESGSGTFEQPYSALLVATGARALTIPFDGGSLERVFTLHDMDSAAAIRAYLQAPGTVDPEDVGWEYVDRDLVERYDAMTPPETVALVGGGYVGVEMAEVFAAHDLTVHLFQRGSHVLPGFDAPIAERVEAHLADEGVRLHTDTPVERIRGTGALETVEFDGGSVDVDAALVGVGIRPNTDLVAGSGIERGASGAIRTDEYGRTTREDVFAAGDCAEARHAVTGEPTWIPLGLTANRAGRAVGRTVAGEPTPTGDVVGTTAVKAMDLEAARAGILDPDVAADAGFDLVAETVTASSRSGYYPGAAETTVTLAADRESGRLLGGSIVGRDTAAKRIDTVATALDSGLTVGDVVRLDLSYAPPFSPVWDPILVAAKVLDGTLS